ncbi:hypothetical protein KKA47_00005, partial [bacterium]|nr:hypothetical protein [bacterium]
MKSHYKNSSLDKLSRVFLLITAAAFILSACAGGEDYMPNYFGKEESEKVESDKKKDEAPQGSVSKPEEKPEEKAEETTPEKDGDSKPAKEVSGCTVYLDSTLCVTIKGEQFQLGIDPKVCTKVGSIPIHVDANSLTLTGNEFPIITVNDPNVPFPLLIDGKGLTDGVTNIGTGSFDEDGNIEINDFSLFITALGMTGELKHLTLTTGIVSNLAFLPEINGSPMDDSGKTTIIVALNLPSLFPAADSLLLGASLTAIFDGKITPKFQDCTEGGQPPVPTSEKIKITKTSYFGDTPVDEEIPNGTDLYIGGAFIPKSEEDIGNSFSSKAEFKITNISEKDIEISIPEKINRFHFEADSFTKTIAPNETFIFAIVFIPEVGDAEGDISESIEIAGSTLFIKASAEASGSKLIVNTVSESTGKSDENGINTINFGSVTVNVAPKQAFFECSKITCEGEDKLTNCNSCGAPEGGTCHLLPISKSGKPFGIVGPDCKTTDAGDEDLTMNVGGENGTLHNRKELIEIRNSGTEEIIINSIRIDDIGNSKSTDQFNLNEGSIYMVSGDAPMDSITDELGKASLPITIPPYDENNQIHIYVVVTYEPTDLIGSEGGIADRANLVIETNEGPMIIELAGSTDIAQAPPLEAYIKTTDGMQKLGDGSVFAYRGLSSKFNKSSAPLYLKLSDNETSSIIIKNIEISGRDIDQFKWESGGSISCPITGYDLDNKQVFQEVVSVNTVNNNNYEISAGLTQDTMPAFGCLIFNYPGDDSAQPQYIANIKITAEKSTAASNKEIDFNIKFIAVTDPMKGKFVLRVTQTLAAIQARKFPSISATASGLEFGIQLKAGEVDEIDRSIHFGAIEIDPFDENELTNRYGEVISAPGDGATAIFRALDTHPTKKEYDNPYVFNFMSLLHDETLPEGSKGIFFDFPNVPKDLKASSLRIFTSTLSYPGPLGSPRPEGPSRCIIVDPCDNEGKKAFSKQYIQGDKGACAFFNTSVGNYSSPSFHPTEYIPNRPEPMENGELADLCKVGDVPQNIEAMNQGHFSMDGKITFENLGLRFYGPTFVHNPYSPIEPRPDVLDVIFNIAFTTEILSPNGTQEGYVTVPDQRLWDNKKFMVNLTDESLDTKPICSNNVKNKKIGEKGGYSSWKYLAPFLWQDEAGTIQTGCPEDDNDLTGGTAYVSGRRLDRETGIFSVAAAGTFGPAEEMSPFFQDATLFMIMNGWLCDPNGSPEAPYYEGSECFNPKINKRDESSQVTVMEEEEA